MLYGGGRMWCFRRRGDTFFFELAPGANSLRDERRNVGRGIDSRYVGRRAGDGCARWESLSGKGVLGRARVGDLLKHDKRSALVAARQIEHPWYRCQALSSVADASASPLESEKLLEEAFRAAYAQAELNRVASVALWQLALLAKLNPMRAAIHTAELLRVIAQEPHGLRRLGGLCAILMAVAQVESLRPSVLNAFLATASVSEGWRTERIVDTAACVLIPIDWEAAQALLASRPATRYTKRSRTLLG